LVYLWQLLC